MKTEVDDQFCKEAFRTIREGYDNFRPNGSTKEEIAESYRGLVRSFSRAMKRYPAEVVALAVSRVHKCYSEKFPNAGQFEKLLAAQHRAWKIRHQPKLAGEDRPASKPGEPFDGPIARACNELAEKWEADIRLREAFGDELPQEIGQQRSRDLNAITGTIGGTIK